MPEYSWGLFVLLALAQFIGTGMYVRYLTDRPEIPDMLVSLLFVIVGAVVGLIWTVQWALIVMLSGAVTNVWNE
ncbi:MULTISPECIES: hypothetical protein [Haloarcula]|uniref:Uncharacterized protein n=1 Tax=Haloarcula amylolytica JCM 13557 TaxID=1227452 RepID=M0K089_9EURY|nr:MULTISPECIES: hypothetical protein [Haloarcula]EMA14188.1 hypothetical protein C442_20241 [Haloarcula amylolytica JCM 13557]